VSIEIDTKLKAFVPDYIPTVGEVDAFIKMPRPDGQPETLGLNILVTME
jgi:intraflagellar transport protein 46